MNPPQKKTDILMHSSNFIHEIKEIVTQARQKAYSAINSAMVEAYWQMGKRIVDEEQQGKERADYGTQLLKELSKELTKEFGKGFSVPSLYNFRLFYLTFSEIFSTPWRILTWSHYKRLLTVSNSEARAWYLKEAAEQMWSYRTLDRNISSQYYERLLLSQNKNNVAAEMKSLTKAFEQDKLEFIKNPTVAEFIGLAPNTDFTESELEMAIIGNLQKFLLELGKGFSFVSRQQLIRTEKRDYFVDLVFYNYRLKCFVLLDLKTTKISHQDVGQMDMYVRMYDERVRDKDDNPTIGIILCSETDEDIARYSILNENKQLYASKYMLYMPSEEELRNEIERQKAFFRLQHQKEMLPK
ncbi:YhcG family protein [Bacteroides sp. 519]|uniref:PDDEXK nuclease domain-containing protein n=1 Tax=Bacteroides sp. 519 TaxID=2302937 RepID=UPI001EF2B244|nr:PDDEXK nuclease domain-containing protein [Bacteroides sp. 519]